MKRILLSALALGLLSLPVVAQPEENETLPIPPDQAVTKARIGAPKEYLETDIKNFIGQLNTYPFDSGPGGDFSILDGRVGFFGKNEWGRWWKTQITAEQPLKYVSSEIKSITPVNVATVLVKYVKNTYGNDVNYPETLSLKWDNTQKRWQIDPQKPTREEYLMSASLRWAAYMITQRPGAIDDFYGELSANNLKQTALGALQLIQDYDQRFAFSAPFWQEAIYPYVKNNKLFVQPDSKKPYSFNNFLSDKTLGEIANPAQTVLFYEGEKETLSFRENGFSAVCFVDGHVKLVDAADAQNLIWKP